MSIHVPWAEQAQLTEHTTQTNYVGSLRDCVARYEVLPAEAKVNVLLMADADIPLPGRSTGKILEQPELETLLGLFDPAPLSTTGLARLLDQRMS